MDKIKLITDSASDISYENEKLYDIQVIPFKLAVGDRTYISRIDFDNEKFYKLLEEYDGIPATSQITPFEFTSIFEEHYKSGYTDVIYIAINSEGSSTYSNACIAEECFFEEHTDAKDKFRIHNIDSASYTGCYGYAVVQAGRMIQSGKNASEIVGFIRDWCRSAAAFFVPYTLKYAAKSGRIPGLAAFVGNALGIKPLMLLHDHDIISAGKVRSDKHIIPEIVKRTTADMENSSPYCIVYGSDRAVAEELEAAMLKAVGYPPSDYYQIGAAIAVNAGPKVVGIIFRRNLINSLDR